MDAGVPATHPRRGRQATLGVWRSLYQRDVKERARRQAPASAATSRAVPIDSVHSRGAEKSIVISVTEESDKSEDDEKELIRCCFVFSVGCVCSVFPPDDERDVEAKRGLGGCRFRLRVRSTTGKRDDDVSKAVLLAFAR